MFIYDEVTFIYSDDFIKDFSRKKVGGQFPRSIMFGHNPNTGTTFEDIWVAGDVMQYYNAGETISIVSDSSEDASGGTGVGFMFVSGIDANGLEISEVVVLAGTTPVLTQFSYKRLTLAVAVGPVGSVETNVGTITFTGTVSGFHLGSIQTGEGMTHKSHITVPANKTIVITDLTVNCGKGNDFEIRTQIRNIDQPWRTVSIGYVFENQLDFSTVGQLELTENVDIRFQAKTSGGSKPITIIGNYFSWTNP